jgi:hypothetical protein
MDGTLSSECGTMRYLITRFQHEDGAFYVRWGAFLVEAIGSQAMRWQRSAAAGSILSHGILHVLSSSG